MGASAGCFQVCPALFFGRRHLGAIQGVASTTNVAATAIGPLLFGVLHDRLGTYSPILLGIAALTAVCALLAAAFLRQPVRGAAEGGRERRGTELAPARAAA